MSILSHELPVTVFAFVMLFTLVSFAILYYLAASGVGAGKPILEA